MKHHCFCKMNVALHDSFSILHHCRHCILFCEAFNECIASVTDIYYAFGMISVLFFDDPDVCQTKGNVYWLKQHISLIIIGRGSSHRHLYEDCSIVLGTISMKSLLMQFSFEACYIGDCGVVLELNQSDTSNFSPASSVMVRRR